VRDTRGNNRRRDVIIRAGAVDAGPEKKWDWPSVRLQLFYCQSAHLLEMIQNAILRYTHLHRKPPRLRASEVRLVLPILSPCPCGVGIWHLVECVRARGYSKVRPCLSGNAVRERRQR
jgi:hypothetical protein